MLTPSLGEYLRYLIFDLIPDRFSHLPNIRAFAIFPVLAAQSSLLLVPQDSRTQYARKAIVPLGLYYAYTVLQYDFTPRDKWTAFNFIKNLACPIGIAKTLEYGFVRQQYRWIGYDEAYNPKPKYDSTRNSEDGRRRTEANGHGVTNDDAFGPREHKNVLDELRKKPSAPSTLLSWQTVKDVMSLNLSHRGYGWNWGIKGSLIPKPYPQSTFLRHALLHHIRSHILLVACISTIQYSGFPNRTDSFLYGLLQFLRVDEPASKLVFPGSSAISEALLAITFGTAVWNFLDLAYLEVAIGACFLTTLGRNILPSILRPPPFDTRTWPPLLQNPLWSTSLADWWTYRWHSVLRREFVIMGFRPARYLTKWLGRDISALFGVVGAFAASGALHDLAIYTASWERPFEQMLPSMRFFLLQGLGLVAEQMFTRLTGRQVGGFFGRLWILLVIGFPGAMMTRAWLSRGLLDAQPTPDDWDWWRWAIPAFMYLPRLR